MFSLNAMEEDTLPLNRNKRNFFISASSEYSSKAEMEYIEYIQEETKEDRSQNVKSMMEVMEPTS